MGAAQVDADDERGARIEIERCCVAAGTLTHDLALLENDALGEQVVDDPGDGRKAEAGAGSEPRSVHLLAGQQLGEDQPSTGGAGTRAFQNSSQGNNKGARNINPCGLDLRNERVN